MPSSLGFSRVVAMLCHHEDLEAILVLIGKDNKVCGIVVACHMSE